MTRGRHCRAICHNSLHVLYVWEPVSYNWIPQQFFVAGHQNRDPMREFEPTLNFLGATAEPAD